MNASGFSPTETFLSLSLFLSCASVKYISDFRLIGNGCNCAQLLSGIPCTLLREQGLLAPLIK
jgi:hypothetical protein